MQITSNYNDIIKIVTAFEDFIKPISRNPKEAIHLSLALTEILNNIVEHGLYGEDNHLININWEVENNILTIKIVDYAGTVNLTQIFKQANLPNPQDLPEQGWGFGIVKEVFDEVKFTTKNTTNRTTLYKSLCRD